MPINVRVLKKAIQKALSLANFITDGCLGLQGAAERAREVNVSHSAYPTYPYHFVMVRTDLNPEEQVTQVCHAAYEAGSKFGTEGCNGSIVVTAVKNEERLLCAAARLETRGIPYLLWREADLGNQATALGTAPLAVAQRKAMSRYKMWRS